MHLKNSLKPLTSVLESSPVFRVAFGLLALIFVGFGANLVLPGGLPLGIVFFGVVQGGLYSLSALGLVLLYRSQRIINFSQASIGGLSVSVCIVLVDQEHVSYYLAVVAGLLAAMITGAIVEIVFIRRLSRAPRLIVTIATLGIAQLVGFFEVIIPQWFNQTTLITFGAPFKISFTIRPIIFTGDYLVALGAIFVALVLMWIFLERTSTGIAIRASADSIDRARLLGIPVKRLSLITWLVASLLSGVAAIVSAPSSMGNPPDLTVAAGPIVLLAPLAAAVLGRMESLVVTAITGCAIGVFQQAVFWSYPHSTYVDVGLLIIIVASLLVQPPAISRGDSLGPGSYVAFREFRPIKDALANTFPARTVKAIGPILVLILVLLVPANMSQATLLPFAYIGIFVLVAISLVVLAGWAGQISLGQFGFAGVGAAITGAMLENMHADLFLALISSAFFGALTAVVVGMPALRINGLFLAVATMAFAVPVDTFLLNATQFPYLNPPHVSPPILFNHFDLSNIHDFYVFTVVLVAIALILAWNFRKSRGGRVLVALRENDPAAQSYGVSPLKARLSGFALSGAMAGVAGGLFVILQQGISFSGFDPELSISAFTMVVIGGLGSLSGAILGAFYVGGATYFLHGAYQLLATSVGLLVLLMFLPEGLGGLFNRLRETFWDLFTKFAGNSKREASGAELRQSFQSVRGFHSAIGAKSVMPDTQNAISEKGTDCVASLSGINASYGHVQVLFDVNLTIEKGTTTALLGTNGAGKSTILRVLSGLMTPDGGKIGILGKQNVKSSAESRVKDGFVTVPGGRGIFQSLSVEENLKVATWTTKNDVEFLSATFDKIFKLFPVLKERKDSKAWMLSGGEQQMLTISQSLLCKPNVLLVDELSLGLSPIVVSQLIGAVNELVADGISVVVVEQSVNVAASIASHAVFLERGTVRYDGDMPGLLSRNDLLRSVFITSGPPASVDEAEAKLLAGQKDQYDPWSNGSGNQSVFEQVEKTIDSEVFSVRHVSKRFGGVSAVEDVSIAVNKGEIHGIIGANGAGKTTLFDICSGYAKPDNGKVILQGEEITFKSPSNRASLGLGRIFQHAGLFPSLSVRETLTVAHERFLNPRDPVSSMLRLPALRKSEKSVKSSVEYLLALLHLEDFENAFISELSTGTRRIVEIACALAHRPQVLLLDEPSSGLAQREAEALGPMLKEIRDLTGAALIVIEHDVPLISSIADHLTCLHLGEVLTSDKPQQVLANPAVVAAYLGNDKRAITRSGT